MDRIGTAFDLQGVDRHLRVAAHEPQTVATRDVARDAEQPGPQRQALIPVAADAAPCFLKDLVGHILRVLCVTQPAEHVAVDRRRLLIEQQAPRLVIPSLQRLDISKGRAALRRSVLRDPRRYRQQQALQPGCTQFTRRDHQSSPPSLPLPQLPPEPLLSSGPSSPLPGPLWPPGLPPQPPGPLLSSGPSSPLPGPLLSSGPSSPLPGPLLSSGPSSPLPGRRLASGPSSPLPGPLLSSEPSSRPRRSSSSPPGPSSGVAEGATAGAEGGVGCWGCGFALKVGHPPPG